MNLIVNWIPMKNDRTRTPLPIKYAWKCFCYQNNLQTKMKKEKYSNTYSTSNRLKNALEIKKSTADNLLWIWKSKKIKYDIIIRMPKEIWRKRKVESVSLILCRTIRVIRTLISMLMGFCNRQLRISTYECRTRKKFENQNNINSRVIENYKVYNTYYIISNPHNFQVSFNETLV